MPPLRRFRKIIRFGDSYCMITQNYPISQEQIDVLKEFEKSEDFPKGPFEYNVTTVSPRPSDTAAKLVTAFLKKQNEKEKAVAAQKQEQTPHV